MFTRYNIARSNTSGNNNVIITDAPEARIDRLPENVYEFEFDYRQNKILDLGYIRVSFEDVSAYSIRYLLSE